jgi:hypothetical protein
VVVVRVDDGSFHKITLEDFESNEVANITLAPEAPPPAVKRRLIDVLGKKPPPPSNLDALIAAAATDRVYVPIQVRKGMAAWRDASLIARDASTRVLSWGFCDGGGVMSFDATTADAAEGWQLRLAPVATHHDAHDVTPAERAGARRGRSEPHPVPFHMFDTAWCAAVCGDGWHADIDSVTRMRAHVVRHSKHVSSLTLRGAAPLPRRLLSTGTSQQLPSYRVVIEAYPAPFKDEDTQECRVGFVPSRTSTGGAAVAPVVGNEIADYGGWWFGVAEDRELEDSELEGSELEASELEDSEKENIAVHGWSALPPRGAAPVAADSSAYATTDVVPPVPVGGAIELAVDYAAGACRVAFYTPAAVARGFSETPYAKMEFRFVATPASGVKLYPAIETGYAGAVFRFA